MPAPCGFVGLMPMTKPAVTTDRAGSIEPARCQAVVTVKASRAGAIRPPLPPVAGMRCAPSTTGRCGSNMRRVSKLLQCAKDVLRPLHSLRGWSASG
jgi:hypothetical protein